MTDFSTFRVLLDEPAPTPVLGYDDYSRAFADIIRHSAPRFAIGIFGDWGSGKTTLMRAINKELDQDEDIVTVWFNAWRYEREEHLIVPLLDTLREALAEWRRSAQDDGARRALAAASIIGRAARTLAAGLKLSASVMAVGVDVDPKAMMDQWDDEKSADAPSSFYHATFRAMSGAIKDFVEQDEAGDTKRRVVVFVDDLDRCLPENALQVLESMKLFFDLPGFVFVVGLDQGVIKRSIEAKYEPSVASAADGTKSAPPPVSGGDYIKKIFQVPFGLPRVNPDDLFSFFTSVVEGNGLPKDQKDDLRKVVWPHLEETTRGVSVNPRELKRLINAYTLQMKLLGAKLPVEPNPDVVLALQVIAFRVDWERLYELLTADPDLFVAAITPVVKGQSPTFSLSDEPIPQSFLDYCRGSGARLLDPEATLDIYVTSAESTRSSDPEVLEAQRVVAEMRRLLKRLEAPQPDIDDADALSELQSLATQLSSRLKRRGSSSLATEALGRLTELEGQLGAAAAGPRPRAGLWVAAVRATLESLDNVLRLLRREIQVGSTSAA